ncbi:TetR family transcriptional regulator [Sinomicrobium weinanense]|uniref:TetR/AcrR family transcriptional regulator n=1 Tax=Sinomicrobium weinanense TaxID=2842200 RepID=A0A926Q2C8_9FLAO|nr:TetR family transcriptional regulator [Sinomicrobium weinanense]MBC9794771.1 TetR/AcrR family transcriptional regulator [Sinomicrobium weinanense]MBU3125030.1 TetR family transcriptional regulator [Sinomicrobium weinanense]
MELNEKQAAILEVAEKLFAENGFDGTSVRQIAREANINIAMISYYFGSKEKLLDALLYHRLAGFRHEMEKVMLDKGDHMHKVDRMVALIVTRIHRNRRAYKVVSFEYSNPSRQVSFENYIRRKKDNYSMIEKLIKSGQKAGVFSKKVNIPLLIPTILGTYFHFYNHRKFFEALHGLDGKQTVEDYVNTTLIRHIQQTVKALLTYEMPRGKSQIN